VVKQITAAAGNIGKVCGMALRRTQNLKLWHLTLVCTYEHPHEERLEVQRPSLTTKLWQHTSVGTVKTQRQTTHKRGTLTPF